MGTKTDYRTKKENETEIGKKTIDRIVESRQFEPERCELPKNKYFIFRWIGDEIEGILCPPITNFRRNTSYPIEKPDGEIVEIFGNKILHNLIRQNDLIGCKVRIVYIGRQAIPHCRPRKIYRIYKREPRYGDSELEMYLKRRQKKTKEKK